VIKLHTATDVLNSVCIRHRWVGVKSSTELIPLDIVISSKMTELQNYKNKRFISPCNVNRWLHVLHLCSFQFFLMA